MTHKRREIPEFKAAWSFGNDVLMRKFTGHLAVHEIRTSVDLARDYGVCHVPGALSATIEIERVDDFPLTQEGIEIDGVDAFPPSCQS